MSDSLKTALYDEHIKLGGKVVDFCGWQLPIQYSTLKEEHLACRSAAGLFDVSHMGEFFIEGVGAENFVNYIITSDTTKAQSGKAIYTALCKEDGGIVDDLIVYKFSDIKFLLVVNAANEKKDFNHIINIFETKKTTWEKITIQNRTLEFSQIAIQGRLAEKILQEIALVNLSDISYYSFKEGSLLGNISSVIARTGYTGEDGFELYVPWGDGVKVWNALIKIGSGVGLKPVGLGARDTLRLEMKFPLYGHELSESTNPYEAGLGWVVQINKNDFIGKSALAAIKEAGCNRRLVGFKTLTRGVPRSGYEIIEKEGDSKIIGQVTSGTFSPSLDAPIGIAYVPHTFSKVGSRFFIKIRNQQIPAEVIQTPFYKVPYKLRRN